MLLFLGRRAAESAVVLTVVTVAAFGMFRYVGDPVDLMLGESADADARASLRSELRLDQPLPAQLGAFVGRLSHGDFGRSYRSGAPVAGLLVERAPATVELALFAMFLATLFGVPLGVWTAVHREGVASRFLESLALVGVSMPTFLTGVLLMFVFAVELQWLPAFGRGDVKTVGVWSTGLATASGWKSIVLPALTLAWLQTATIQRVVRDEMIETLDSDFIRFARVRGVGPVRLYVSHALRNAILPVITIGGVQFGSLVAFSLVTEAVFQWPGLGLLFVEAVNFADIPVMAAYLLVVAVMFVSINFFVDVLHVVLDPRLSHAWGARPETARA